jgi:PH (Pleckstrin Homology) domain-containing protein
VSTQQEPAVPGPGTEPATPAVSEKKVYRLPGPQVLWWVWVVFLAANLLDLAIQGHDYESLQITVGLLAITGLVYACTLRPRVITDADGLTMVNPLREYRIPWPRLAEVYLGESVQFKCSAGDGASAKTLHSWALYSPRKARLKADIRGRKWERGAASRPGGYGQMPTEGRDAARRTATEFMAREIDAKAREAVDNGATGGRVEGHWAWWTLAGVVLGWPLLALVVALH